MKNVTYAINLSADGCCDHTKFNPNSELMNYWVKQMNSVDLIVWGRKTYELMVPYWPDVARDKSGTDAENAFAQRLADIPKVVFSRTLKSAEGNTRVINGDLAEEFSKLKQGSGNISIGGVSLPEQLIALGLVDDIRFVVHPVIAGAGRRIFQDTPLDPIIDLKLAETTSLGPGCIELHYTKQ